MILTYCPLFHPQSIQLSHKLITCSDKLSTNNFMRCLYEVSLSFDNHSTKKLSRLGHLEYLVKIKHKKWRWKGGIEPLRISASTDLKSAQRTTPDHPSISYSLFSGFESFAIEGKINVGKRRRKLSSKGVDNSDTRTFVIRENLFIRHMTYVAKAVGALGTLQHRVYFSTFSTLSRIS